jgi:radical SAM superfamily enzyme YgiQ (UPF0313 family)
MKVLLVQPHLGRKEIPPIFPIGLCYIANALTKHNATILDLNIWELPYSYKMLEQKILEFDPDIIGISIRNIDTCSRTDVYFHFKTIVPTVQLIKKVNPKIKLIVGGPGFSMFAHDIMERIPDFDFGIFLEGEESVPELLEHLDAPETVKGIFIRKDESLNFTGFRKPPDFNKLSIPRRDKKIINIEHYISANNRNIGIQTKRGCALKCIYCNYPFLNGMNLRLRSPINVVNEIEYLISLGIKAFSFLDNVFNVPKNHAKEICREIIKRGLKIEWCAWYEIRNADEELMHLAADAGCKHFDFSPDAATNKGLSILNKGITEDDIKENLRIVSKLTGIKAKYNFFFSLPGMEFQDKIKTLILYFKLLTLLLLGKEGGGGGTIGWIRVEYNTKMYRYAIDEGLISKEISLLPTDEKGLVKLFYFNRSYKYFDFFVLYFIKFTEQIIKPAGKFLQRYLIYIIKRRE